MGVLREILFSPGVIAEREMCYDRLESLRKLGSNRSSVPSDPGNRRASTGAA